MRAVTFQGAKDIQVKDVQDPSLQTQDDIIVRITSTAICGSDLHIYLGTMPTSKDFVIGHEPMGIVEEIGANVTRVKKATASFFRSMFLAATATIAIMIWKVNATIPMASRMSIPVDTWVTPNAMVTILEGRLNICACRTGTLCRLSSRSHANWRMRPFSSCPMFCLLPIGAWKMPALSQVIL